MVAPVTYGTIGHGYARHRREDPRIASAINDALAGAESIANVGAGTGSYEPRGKTVVAIEPSSVMIAQRRSSTAQAVAGFAEALPLGDECVDAALAVLTIHHWNDQIAGLSECVRVARQRVVILTWDPDSDGFWLVRDYFPEIIALDRKIFPSISKFETAFGAAVKSVEVVPLPVPADCEDGFLGAFWRRPTAYLETDVRSSISSFSRIGDLSSGLERLDADLKSRAWQKRNANLLEMSELDVGYQLVIASKS